MNENDYEIRLVKILDARHIEDTGTEDSPSYNQYIQLLLQDSKTGGTFIGQYSAEEWKELNNLDFDLHSKEMIEIAEWLRDNVEQEVKLLVPRNGGKIDKSLLLNTPASAENEQPSFRSAAIKRFKFDKEKLKKAN
jgi:hypothetical protein